MGKRGFPPQPTSLKLLRGVKPSRINFDEPKPLDMPIEPPELSPGALAVWHKIVPHLTAMGTATALDVPVLAMLCEAFARWEKLAKIAADADPLIQRDTSHHHGLIRNPVFQQVRDAEYSIRMLAREFGLTPAARSGIRVEHIVRAPSERILENDA